MAATSWMGRRVTGRVDPAVMLAHRRANARKRAWTRDIARLMLVASVLVLGVLAVEIGRKAVTIHSHGAAQNTVQNIAEIAG